MITFFFAGSNVLLVMHTKTFRSPLKLVTMIFEGTDYIIIDISTHQALYIYKNKNIMKFSFVSNVFKFCCPIVIDRFDDWLFGALIR